MRSTNQQQFITKQTRNIIDWCKANPTRTLMIISSLSLIWFSIFGEGWRGVLISFAVLIVTTLKHYNKLESTVKKTGELSLEFIVWCGNIYLLTVKKAPIFVLSVTAFGLSLILFSFGLKDGAFTLCEVGMVGIIYSLTIGVITQMRLHQKEKRKGGG